MIAKKSESKMGRILYFSIGEEMAEGDNSRRMTMVLDRSCIGIGPALR